MIILRVTTDIDESYCHSLINEIKKYDGCCDEVWLPTLYGYPKIETHRQHAEKLSRCAQIFRNAGIKVSLQLSNTIGHGEYMASLDCSGLLFENSPVQKIIDFTGIDAGHCFCWNNSFFKQYISSVLIVYADIKPETLWIDDDCRILGHDPVEMGCFCEHCLALFNSENNTSFNREELQNKLLYHDVDLQDKFLRFISDKVGDFYFETLSEFHKKSPNTEFGVENGDLETELLCGDYMYQALKRLNGKPPKVRPGYGCYNDHIPDEIFLKTIRIEWLNFRTPKDITYLISENEDNPSVAYGKSIVGNCLESSLYLATGTNHVSFTTFQRRYENFEFSGENLSEFSRLKPLWQKIIDNNKISSLGGACYACSSSNYRCLSKVGQGISEFHKYVYTELSQIYRLGIPFCIGINKDKVNFLSGTSAKTLSDSEIEFLLDCNVICDGEAMEYLINKGYDFGIEVSKLTDFQSSRAFEKPQKHAINNFNYPRWKRSFCDGIDYSIKAKDNAYIEIISKYLSSATDCNDFNNEDVVANAVVKTTRGKKWIVFGYYLWNDIVSFDKRNQILNAIEYLLPNSTSLKLVSPTQTFVMVKENDKRKVSAFYVVNCSLGLQKNLKFKTNSDSENISAFTISGKAIEVTKNKNEVVLSELMPYDMVCVFLGDL